MKNKSSLCATLLALALALSLTACGASNLAGTNDANAESASPSVEVEYPTSHDPAPQTLDLTNFSSVNGVGEYGNDAIIGSGAPGYLLYGPYMPLAQGTYRVHIVGKLLSGELDDGSRFDVANDAGNEIIAITDNLGQFVAEDGSLNLTADFEAEHNLPLAEFRIYVNEGPILVINSVTLTDTTKYTTGELEWPEEETSADADTEADAEAVDDADAD